MALVRFVSYEAHAWVGAAHQNAVEVISGHIGGRSRQQGPGLSFVVCDESLDVDVHQFVGKIHAVYPLHLGHKVIHLHCVQYSEKKKNLDLVAKYSCIKMGWYW